CVAHDFKQAPPRGAFFLPSLWYSLYGKFPYHYRGRTVMPYGDLYFWLLIAVISSLLYGGYELIYGRIAREARYESERIYCAATFAFYEAEELLDKWQAARPFLFIGQSAYARSLLCRMIESYTLMLIYDEQLDATFLTELYELLDDQPPPDDSPLTKPSGAVSFYPIPICAIFRPEPGNSLGHDEGGAYVVTKNDLVCICRNLDL
ncbi:MAG: hypothetical protein WA058_01615, partial [Minisyncoccia bacterium]